ncbi:hypothetical protein GCM10011579_028560 [Streptomyces albiflavescens]|uniref:Uncharacterized protein n=1 Tax=Streptomyces albiflavescens TaxID=1623582 RepID=A0A917Y033_9ACTN|nr:hypothetical protein [Streptomyces albiflavescens]GGN61856.1 hypothetical protein GCM10011579_028560 [Streptomyces albiflavescens]
MAVTVHIPEYVEDCALVAGEDLAREPAFWLAHLLLTVGDPSEDPERYGVGTSAYEEMVERLGNPEEPWPVLRVPFDGGHTAYVVYANFEDLNNVDFFVRHPEWGRLGYLGQYGADEASPGLSWTELTVLAEAAQDKREGLTDGSQRLLLLLPMLGDADMPSEARPMVAQALSRCGIRSDAADELATALLGEQEPDGEPRWTVTTDNPIAVCSSSNSPRRIPLALGITPGQSQALADAFNGRR